MGGDIAKAGLKRGNSPTGGRRKQRGIPPLYILPIAAALLLPVGPLIAQITAAQVRDALPTSTLRPRPLPLPTPPPPPPPPPGIHFRDSPARFEEYRQKLESFRAGAEEARQADPIGAARSYKKDMKIYQDRWQDLKGIRDASERPE
jgi:hypothetical protein